MELYSSKKKQQIMTLPEVDEKTAVEKILKEGATFKELYNIDADHLEELYSLADHYYNHGRYEEAAQIFSTLGAIDNKDYRFSFGFASCCHQMHQFELAATFYTIAYHLNPKELQALYFMAEAYYEQGDLKTAKEAFQDFATQAAHIKKYRLLKRKALLMVKGL